MCSASRGDSVAWAAPKAKSLSTRTKVSAAKPAGKFPSSRPAPKKLPRLVDLGAKKCIPCKMMAPILEELRREQNGKLEVVFIDVWENPRAERPYGIRLIPTQILYDAAGKEFFRHEGFFAKDDILAAFKARGIRLPAGAGR